MFDPATPTSVIDQAESHFKNALDTRKHGLNGTDASVTKEARSVLIPPMSARGIPDRNPTAVSLDEARLIEAEALEERTLACQADRSDHAAAAV